MAKKPKIIPSLLKALTFVAVAQKPTGAPYQLHTMLRDRWAVAFDGVLAAGHPIDEDIIAAPNTYRLLIALKKCESAISVAQLDNQRLSVRSGKFNAHIPCSPEAVLPDVHPDPICGHLDDRFQKALSAVSCVISDQGMRVVLCSALVRNGSVVGTNGNVIIEYWHSLPMPEGLLLPKSFIDALAKVNKAAMGFGFSANTFTVHYEDGSWLRTQLYADKWPDVTQILDKPSNQQPLHAEFFKAVHTLKEFAQDNRLIIEHGVMSTSKAQSDGATYELPTVVPRVVLNAKHLLLVEDYIKTIDFHGTPDAAYFFGDSVRGAITHIKA